MDMRLRIPELLAEKGVTAYAVARDSNERISISTIYRLTKSKGRLETYSSHLMEALCDVLDVSPGELLERDKKRR